MFLYDKLLEERKLDPNGHKSLGAMVTVQKQSLLDADVAKLNKRARRKGKR